MKRPSLVIWNDAHATLDEQGADDIIGAHRPSRIESFGYIVRSDEIGISLAGEWLPAANGGDETYRSVTFIPRAMVIEERSRRKRRRGPSSETRGILGDHSHTVDDHPHKEDPT